MNKKFKIIIAAAVAVLLIAGCITGFYFIKKEANQKESVFDETGSVKIISDTEIEFSYICPYMSEDTKFEVLNKDGFFVSSEIDGAETKIQGEIVSTEYTRGGTDTYKTATLTININLSQKLTDGKYRAVLEKGAIELKKEDYTNNEITANFSVSTSVDGKVEAKDDNYADARLSVPSNVSAEIVKEGTKHYFIFKADITGVTKYDEIGMQNYKVILAYGHRVNNRRKYVGVNQDENAIITVTNGSVYVKTEVEDDMLFPGDDYQIVITKGFFINDDKTVVSDEYKGTFTYVEQ